MFYFGGLWVTLQYMNRSRYPVFITLTSYIFRTAVIFIVLFYIARSGQWIPILFWLAGFIIARIILSRLLGSNHLSILGKARRAQSKKFGKE